MLFNKYDLQSLLENNKRELREAILALKPDYILNTSEEDLVAYLKDKWSFDIPELEEAMIHVDYADKQIDVSGDPNRHFWDRSRPFYVQGTEVTFVLPFTGDAYLLDVQPMGMTWSTAGQRAFVFENEIRFTFEGTDLNIEQAKSTFENEMGFLRQNLSNLATSLKTRNTEIESQIRAEIKQRKEKLLRDAQVVASIGFPIKKRDGVSNTYSIPVQKKKPQITKPSMSTGAFQPEPALAGEDYENILTIVGNMVTVMEQSPRAFDSMGEEDLRTHFLVQLNGHYEGRATGETFNFQGKTDILVRENGKNVFIAECKFWKGEKQFLETIDQLLSYLSWRDTKAAIFIFSRNASFSEVLKKISETTPLHSGYKRTLTTNGETSFRYTFAQPNDTNREITLTVMAFDVPRIAK